VNQKERKKLLEELKKVQKKLDTSRQRRAMLTARKDIVKEEEQQLIEDGISQYDAKGRLLYGDAWDTAVDGQIPLRELLSLPEEELRLLRVEAYKQIAEWEQRKKAQGIPDPPGAPKVDPLLIGRSLRSQTPHPEAPFDDSRFVQPRKQSARQVRQSAPPKDAPFPDERFLRSSSENHNEMERKSIALELSFQQADTFRKSTPPKDSPFHDSRFFDASSDRNESKGKHQRNHQEQNGLQLPRPDTVSSTQHQSHRKKNSSRIRLLPDPNNVQNYQQNALLHPHRKQT